MPPINIMIKPASSACNMACSYCFYRDVAAHREQAFEGMISLEDMEQVVRAGMEYAEHICSFAFQGGEPTLAGLDFYRRVVELQKKYARPGVAVHNAIQINGYLIDEEWAAFFAENHFLVGLSLDGPAELHNLNRLDAAGEGTFNRVLRAAHIMESIMWISISCAWLPDGTRGRWKKSIGFTANRDFAGCSSSNAWSRLIRREARKNTTFQRKGTATS